MRFLYKNDDNLMHSPTVEEFHVWLITLAAHLVGSVIIIGFWLHLYLKTTKRRRRTVSFGLASILTLAGLLWVLSSTVVAYFKHPINFSHHNLRIAIYCVQAASNFHLTSGEIALAWMIWLNVQYFPDVDNFAIPGIITLTLILWNCSFFSALFIYRYVRKLKAVHRKTHLFKEILKFSYRHATIPTTIAIVYGITASYRSFIPSVIHIVFGVAFRLTLTILIAQSLTLMNYGNDCKRKNQIELDCDRSNTIHLTAINLASSFGLERKAEKILENFLVQVQTIFAWDHGYFVELNSYGQISVPFGFSIKKQSMNNPEVRLFSPTGRNVSSDVPIAAIEYAISEKRIIFKDFTNRSFVDNRDEDLDMLLGDRLGCLTSILLLPLTLPDSKKTKLIYMEMHGELEQPVSTCELRTLDLIGKQLATSLDSARLFAELEEINRSLDEKVNARTAELELKNALLEKTKNEALEAASAKAVFLSNMSHEIRTPISQVILAAEMLSETSLNTDERDNVNIITQSGKLLLNLVNDILDFSKLENGKIIIEEVEMDLHETIRISVEAFTTESNVWLAYYLPPDLPRFIIGDATRIRQIITNLVSNALKFTKEGFVLVVLNCQPVDQTETCNIHDIEFKVIDTGTGIAADKLQRIFERFEQTDVSVTRLHGGTGLGLSICQNLCHLMGSKITVTSSLGEGSSFQFTIRLRSHPSTSPSLSPSLQLPLQDLHILILSNSHYYYNSESILYYQLETMGAVPYQLSFEPELDLSNLDCIIMDLTPFNGKCPAHQIPIPIFPIIIIHREDQNDTVSDLVKSFTNFRTLCHPFKQSGLHIAITELLSPQDDLELTAINPSEITEPITPGGKDTSNDAERTLSILVVEDNLVNQKIITKLIKKMGYEVDIAENGLVGLEMAIKTDYDLIFMDMRMPVMDGLEATRRIRLHYKNQSSLASSPHTPPKNLSFDEIDLNYNCKLRRPYIVGLSADVLRENQEEGINAGMDLYLTKPILKAKLQEVIKNTQALVERWGQLN
ncbi:hypothetical protein BKA69DRAFT_265017 [Paraphysoderma sedebokerense]|nr:hypothetical protein BKA69DRAFT_265017 [Paraphysoderma sedebokerense]